MDNKDLELEQEAVSQCETEELAAPQEEAVEETAAPEEEIAEPEEVPVGEEDTPAEEKKEEAPAKKKAEKKAAMVVTVSVWKIVAATVVMVVLLFALVGAVIYGITGELPYNLGAKETTAPALPTETTAPPRTAEELGMTIEGIADRAVYTADDDALLASADEVVATCGENKLTNRQLRVFYWMEFSSFVSEAEENQYDLLNDYKLDITKPLKDQTVVQSVVTWEQFMLHNALGTWWRYAGLNAMADEAGFEMTDEDKASIAGVAAQLETDAKAQGYENAEAMLQERLGAGCTVEDFTYYMEFTARGDLYANQFQSTYTPTQEDLEQFYELNTEYYEAYGITKDTANPASVRHVLLVPEGAQTDSSTGYITATDDQWAAGEAAAQAVLDAWVAEGATEEGFAALANEKSTDGGSNTNGGLYENVVPGQMVQAFNDWVFDESRKAGDYGIVKTEFGHHLMYFVSKSDQPAWIAQTTTDSMSSGYCLNARLTEAMDQIELTPVLDKVALADVSQEPVEETQTTDPTAATE